MAESKLTVRDSQPTLQAAGAVKVGEDLTKVSVKPDSAVKPSVVKEVEKRFNPVKREKLKKFVSNTDELPAKGYSHLVFQYHRLHILSLFLCVKAKFIPCPEK